MQQTIGNRAVSRLIQTKLKVGKLGDVYEREADQVADRVMQMPNPKGTKGLTNTPAIQPLSIQRMGSEEDNVSLMAMEEEKPIQKQAEDEESSVQMKEEEETKVLQPQMMEEKDESLQMKEEDEPVQTKASNSPAIATPNLESRLSSSQQGGTPLAPDVQNFMEPRFGRSFADVRVHTGSEAVQMNQELNAQAFAHGGDVYFGAGKAPAKDALTAHELTHVVQQNGGQVKSVLQREEENDSDGALEELKKIQGLPMFALLNELNNLSAKSPGILKHTGAGHSVGGTRLQLAMWALTAKRVGLSADFLKKKKLTLAQELPKDQVENIRSFLGFPPDNAAALAEIQGLPMYDLLARLSNLPGETLEEGETGSKVGGPRLLTAIRAVRAKKERGLFDFLTNNKRDLEALPPDQFVNILSFLAVPMEGEIEETINTDLEVNVTIASPSSVQLPGEGGHPGEGEIQLQLGEQPPPDVISKFEEGILKDRSIINGVVLDPNTQEVIGYRVPGTTGLTRLVDREGEVAWQSGIGIESEGLGPLDYLPSVKGVGKVVVSTAGKIVLKVALKKGAASGGKVTLGAIVKMRGTARSLAVKKMMRSQKIAPDILNKGVHFNVGKVELKLGTSKTGLTLESVFSSAKKVDVAKAIREANRALKDPQFRQWLLKQARAGLEMAQQAKNTQRIEYFQKLIETLGPP